MKPARCTGRPVGMTVAIALAMLLKLYYSRAGSEDLAWIIGPTALLTEIFSGLSFSHEPGFGWVDARHQVVIAPVCAGVNFLIISFCMSSFQILRRNGASFQGLLNTLVIAGLAAYLTTIIANTTRIILAITMFGLDPLAGWLTPDMVHRVVGVAVYYLFLCFFSFVIDRFSGRAHAGSPGGGVPPYGKAALLIPLFWYLLFSVGVPLLNNSSNPFRGQFITHAATVVVVTAVMTVILYKVSKWCRAKKTLRRKTDVEALHSGHRSIP